MMIWFLLFACSGLSLLDAEHGAAAWVGPDGRVMGCSIGSKSVFDEHTLAYVCEVEDAAHVRTRLWCTPSCTTRTP